MPESENVRVAQISSDSHHFPGTDKEKFEVRLKLLVARNVVAHYAHHVMVVHRALIPANAAQTKLSLRFNARKGYSPGNQVPLQQE